MERTSAVAAPVQSNEDTRDLEMETDISLAEELPDDIVRHILLRLPAKSLTRFRAVEQSWNEVITSSKFIYQHYQSSVSSKKQASTGAASTGDNSNASSSYLVLQSPLSPKQDHSFTRLSISKDGKRCKQDENFFLPFIRNKLEERPYAPVLICPAGFGIYCLLEIVTQRRALWNPTIRELKELPPSPFYSEDVKQGGNYIYGFGQVDYKDGDFSYKVGLMRKKFDPCDCTNSMSLELYSSSDHSWRLLEDCCRLKSVGALGSFSGWHCRGTVLNRKFHWLAWTDKYDPHIVTFDMTTEEFGRIEVPHFSQHGQHYDFANSLLTKLDDKFLCLILLRTASEEEEEEDEENDEEEEEDEENDDEEEEEEEEQEEVTYLDVWSMPDYNVMGSWTKISTSGPITDPQYTGVVGIDSSIGGMFLVDEGNDDGLYFCCFGSSHAEKLHIGSEVRENILCVECTESLVSLNGMPDLQTKI